jgi:GAF domain-containing protein
MHDLQDAIRALDRFADTVRTPGWTSLFPALEELFSRTLGHRLFSCSVFRMKGPEQGVAARVFSSDTLNYPISGLKDIVPNRWSDIVINRQSTFVANSVEGFADIFPDHLLIASLGLGSVVNLPVIVRGEFVGTVNVLHEAGYYTDDRLDRLEILRLPSVLAFVLSSGALH